MIDVPAQAVVDKLKQHIGELYAQIAILQVQLENLPPAEGTVDES